MSVKYRVWKVRRDGVSQRYRVAPTREHDSAVVGVVSGDLATAESREAQEIARKLLQNPSVQESVYRSVVREYEKTMATDVGPVWFMQHYLARGYPEAEALLVRLATEPSDGNVRTEAIHAIATSTNPRVSRLLREIADKTNDDWTARFAIAELAAYLDITMENMITEGITPAREAVLGALETLGLALQGKWFVFEDGIINPEDEITNILVALNYKRSEFERAAHGQIPTRVEKTLIDGLVSVLSIESLSAKAFGQTLDVIKEWGSEYALSKLRSYLRGALPQWSRGVVTDAINEIEHQLKRNSSQ